MAASRIGWALWALAPVGLVAYHFGPGHCAYQASCAASLQADASSIEADAEALQDLAYAAHLAAIEARRAALADGTPESERTATAATAQEQQAYATAATAWKRVADANEQVLAALGDAAPAEARALRVSRARALVRSGEIWPGIAELEQLVEELDGPPVGQPVDQLGADRAAATTRSADAQLARAAREELATACYYGARLLRLSGLAPQEWMVESGKARQHFRYLAERGAGDESGGALARDASGASADQLNLELVLNLEQSTLVELQGRPIPRDSPCSGNLSNRSACKKPGKKPNVGKDSRGAGSIQEIGPGW